MQNSSVRFHIHSFLGLMLPKLGDKLFPNKFFRFKRVHYRNPELFWQIAYFCCRNLTVWMTTKFICTGIKSFCVATLFVCMAINIFWMATKFVCMGIKSFCLATLFVWMATNNFCRTTKFVYTGIKSFWRTTKISMTLPTVFCTATLFVYTGIKLGRRGVFSRLDATTGGRYRLSTSRQRKCLHKESNGSVRCTFWVWDWFEYYKWYGALHLRLGAAHRTICSIL
jgi:hypothetical protein